MTPESPANDPLLAKLLAAATVAEREEATADLIASHAVPTIEAVLGSRLRRAVAPRPELLEDLKGDVIVRLLHRLQRLTEEPDTAPIRSFADYVAIVAYHRCDDFVRSAYPARSALGNRIRYLLSRDARFAVWQARSGALVAGFAEWRELEPAPAPAAVDLGPTNVHRLRLEELLTRTMARLARPLELSNLVSLIADLLQVTDPGPGAWLGEPPATPAVGPLEQLETLQYLRRLWGEIRALPPRQRLALLLSIRDHGGESMAWLLPVTGVAPRDEIATVLDLEPAEFARLWDEMPVEDNRIATLLGATRQQVINLRKSARERLARRMAGQG